MIFGFCRRQSPCQRRLSTPARPLEVLSNYSLRYQDFNCVARMQAVTGSLSSPGGSGLIQLILPERLNGAHNSNTPAIVRGPQFISHKVFSTPTSRNLLHFHDCSKFEELCFIS